MPTAGNSLKLIERDKASYKKSMINGFGKKGKGLGALTNDRSRKFLASQKARLITNYKDWGSNAEKAFFKGKLSDKI